MVCLLLLKPTLSPTAKPLSRIPRKLLTFSLCCSYISSMSSQNEPSDVTSQSTPLELQKYPTPLSPPLPTISKEIELARAMAASSRSSLFSFSMSDILYEDQWLIVVNKPQGIYCETMLEKILTSCVDSSKSIGLNDVSFCWELCKQNSHKLIDWKELQSSLGFKVSQPELHLANRLDRDTSGVMLITKSHKVASKLVKAFTNHKVRKTYIAQCVGSAPKWENITVKSGHGRSKFGIWRVYAASDVGRTLPGGSVVRDMETSFELLSVNGQGKLEELYECKKGETIVADEKRPEIDAEAKVDEILVRAFPRSGRTHQIRLHCQYLGIPIRGDVKYEGVYEWKGKIYDRHELHAETLSFEHPITGRPLVFHAPLPGWASPQLQPL
ncbi:hypothetical protein K2173_019853 [Erythroxylum novogranatense]|uniref:Pseudouridine synthase RsuA/RluA-like domain-containing protein n=1 Tax=Erythroxylum novogranatense TaxID=1862640 RepID=A0AAV8SN97_9ROSI|nr:hypothetical protein K2173_019853 [Erythroxylum novogranatense]